MKVRVQFVAVFLFVAAACSFDAPEAGPDGAWVGTITTEGNVTTVVNESGSVWGGTARLVEEASIGVESGADEYMFGFVSAVHATDDRIFLIDSQAPIVRALGRGAGHVAAAELTLLRLADVPARRRGDLGAGSGVGRSCSR